CVQAVARRARGADRPAPDGCERDGRLLRAAQAVARRAEPRQDRRLVAAARRGIPEAAASIRPPGRDPEGVSPLEQRRHAAHDALESAFFDLSTSETLRAMGPPYD